MKNKVIVIIGLVLVLAAVVTAVEQYHQYQKQQRIMNAKRAYTQQVIDQRQAQELKDATDRADELARQCQVGLAAYNMLPAATKIKTAAPDCALSLQ